MRLSTIGKIQVSGICIGANPFAGFSHQTSERNKEMKDYYTPEQIKNTLHIAESLGINTLFARTDNNVFSFVSEYWKEGGKIQWISQIVQDQNQPHPWQTWLRKAIDLGASGAYIHGGICDNWLAQGKFENFDEALKIMRAGAVTAGMAGHMPEVHEWVRDNLDVDFQMCSHYNPTDRSQSPHHTSTGEKWDEEDRQAMLEVIATINKPVVHYKVFAGGNKPIVPAFELLGKVMRKNDVAILGFFLKDDPDMIRKDIALFEEHVDKRNMAA